jgi:uncharacterized protein
MNPDVYELIVPEFTTLLEAMKGYFTKATQHAETKKYDVNNLLTARLAPDQYSLAKQVNVACFLAEECTARLAGKANPKFETQEKSIADLTARIDRSITFLKGFTRQDFTGWQERPVDIFFAEGKYLPGMQYLTRMGIPNFYFHLVTVYSILRQNGVDVGKSDYIGPLQFSDKKN